MHFNPQAEAFGTLWTSSDTSALKILCSCLTKFPYFNFALRNEVGEFEDDDDRSTKVRSSPTETAIRIMAKVYQGPLSCLSIFYCYNKFKQNGSPGWKPFSTRHENLHRNWSLSIPTQKTTKCRSSFVAQMQDKPHLVWSMFVCETLKFFFLKSFSGLRHYGIEPLTSSLVGTMFYFPCLPAMGVNF